MSGGADVMLLPAMRRVHQESRGTYGSSRIHKELKEEGWRIGQKRVSKLMRRHDIRAHRKQRLQARLQIDRVGWPRRISSIETSNEHPNQKWLADMIQIATEEGWLHLAAVMDTFSRNIVRLVDGDT